MMKYVKNMYVALVYLFLYAPVIVLIVYSFNNATFSYQWHGATLYWYQALFQDHELLLVSGHSLLIGFLAATIATMIGALGAFALFKYQFVGKKYLNGLVFVLIVVPELVFGISLLMLFSLFKISLGFWTVLLSHVTFCLPFVIVTVLGRLADLDKNLFEAARDLGANEFYIFVKIILPLIMPALIAGWLLSFTLSMDDVIISFFVTGPAFQVLPLYIYSLVHIGITPKINALCTLIFVLTATLFFGSQLFVIKERK